MVRALLSLALAGMAMAQAHNGAPAPPSGPASPAAGQTASSPAGASGSAVAPGEPVLTIHGVCAGADPTAKTAKKTAGDADSCATVLTRADFESLLDAVGRPSQSTPPNVRRSFAQAYVALLSNAQAARKAGLEDTPRFQDALRLQYLRTLGDTYRREMEEKYRTPPQQEIDDAYHQDPAKYVEVKLRRLMVPRNNPAATNKDERDQYDKKALQAASDMHDRAARGEDVEQIQKEAYAALGLNMQPPATDLGLKRKSSLLPEEAEEVFSLQAGEVSKVEHEPSSYVTYKVESRRDLPQEQIKNEISRELAKQKLDSAFKAVTGPLHPEFNPEYFGPEAAPPK